MQLPRARIVHTSIVVSVDDYDVSAVRTEWPLGLKWRDFGATANDDKDGSLRVCTPCMIVLRYYPNLMGAMKRRAGALLSQCLPTSFYVKHVQYVLTYHCSCNCRLPLSTLRTQTVCEHESTPTHLEEKIKPTGSRMRQLTQQETQAQGSGRC